MDKYDELAKTAGAVAGLKSEQIPGFAHVLRELARDERAAKREECAKVADKEAQKLRESASTAKSTEDEWANEQHEKAATAETIAAAIRARGGCP